MSKIEIVKETRKCSCKDWNNNMKLIDNAFILLQIHGGEGYTGKVIEYCPWCGKKLTNPQNGRRDEE